MASIKRIDAAAVERVRDELRANLGAKTISAVLTTRAAVFNSRSAAAESFKDADTGSVDRFAQGFLAKASKSEH